MIDYFFILGIATFMSCVSSGSASSSRTGEHYEDLSAYRPEYELKEEDTVVIDSKTQETETESFVEPDYDVTREVNVLLDSIKYLKEDIDYVDGYTIQVYTGIKRQDANEAKSEVYMLDEDLEPVVTYDQPNFKVKVGQFYTRREALNTYAELKKILPAAIIISERIPIVNE